MISLSPLHSIRGRLLVLAIGVEVLMLTILVSNSLRLLSSAMTDQARSQAEQYHPVLKAALTAPLAQRDYATVQAIISESRSAGGVDYIVVVDQSGKWAGSSGLEPGQQLPQPSKELSLFLPNKEQRYDVAVPISIHNQPLGTLHFGLNLSKISSARRVLVTQGASIAVVEILLSSLIMLLIGYWLTRHLSSLTRVSQQVAAGNLSPPLMPEGNDDVGQLGIAFNTMSRAISERVRELTTARVIAEANARAVYQSEERLKLALSGADLGLWSWDLASNRISYNQEWPSVLGYKTDDLDTSIDAWEALIHPDDIPMVQEILHRHIAGDTPMYETEHRCRSKSGEWRWILDRGRVVEWGSDGSPARLAGTHLDITGRKDAEDKLKGLNEELEERVRSEVQKNREKDAFMLHQDKMASIGQLAAGVAHEINNPIAFIASNLSTLHDYMETLNRFYLLFHALLEKNSSGEEQRMLMEATRDQDIMFILKDIAPLITESTEGAERVKRIVLDLKDFARVDENCYKPTDLNHCIQSTVNIVRNEIKYVADVNFQLEDLPLINCSANQINQVLANLLLNAAHSIDKHGTITVATRHEDDQVILEVTDTGCGMTEEVRKRIFEPFYTTKEVGKGTGLGLTISYDIVKKHGGEIAVESTPGAGTTFTVRLPVNEFVGPL